MTKSNRTLEDILREFVSRFTSTLRDWYQSLEQSKMDKDTVFALPYTEPDSDPESISDTNYSDSTGSSIF
ncbi:hypothetical protein ACOSQ3_027240 [Xanthoceras sorbifolium]